MHFGIHCGWICLRNEDRMVMLFWLQAGRSNGFTAGMQLRPHGPFSKPMRFMQSRDLSQISQEVADHLSYAVAYSPMPSTSYAGGKLVTQHACTEAAVYYLLCFQAQCRLDTLSRCLHHSMHMLHVTMVCKVWPDTVVPLSKLVTTPHHAQM